MNKWSTYTVSRQCDISCVYPDVPCARSSCRKPCNCTVYRWRVFSYGVLTKARSRTRESRRCKWTWIHPNDTCHDASSRSRSRMLCRTPEIVGRTLVESRIYRVSRRDSPDEHLARKRLSLRMISTMYNELITKLEDLSAYLASVTANRYWWRTRTGRGLAVARFYIELVQLDLLHDRCAILYRGNCLRGNGTTHQSRPGRYFTLQFPENFVIRQKLVNIFDVYL